MAIHNIHSCAMSSHFTHIFVSICTRTQPHIPLAMMVVCLVAKVPATGRSVELCHPHPGCLGECLGQLAEQRRRALQSGTQLIYFSASSAEVSNCGAVVFILLKNHRRTLCSDCASAYLLYI